MTGTTWSGTFNGRMQDCHWETGITLGAAARVYNSTFLGNLNLNSVAAVFNCGNVESANVN